MTGPENDEDGPELFQPAPHPDDRLWRHPSEIAAMHAAQANAETVEIPAIVADEVDSRSRLHMGLRVAAGLVVVGAAALTLGIVSSSSTANDAQVAGILPIAEPVADQPQLNSVVTTEIAAESNPVGAEQLATRLHQETATSLPRVQAATSSGMREGSGLFVTNEGHIATSAGLIAHADYVLVWTEDGQRWRAELVASDAVSDVAIIQIESVDWPAADLDPAADLWAGQYALTLDHQSDEIAFGEVTTISGATVQVDQPAALPGSAILDDTGVVIGMVTSDGSNSHATPAWRLEQVALDLLAHGSTTHTFLGVVVEAHPTADSMVLVQEVIPNSPAADAGIRAGDMIDSVNSTPVPDSATLFREVQHSEPGASAVLTVTRHGNRRIIIAELAQLVSD